MSEKQFTSQLTPNQKDCSLPHVNSDKVLNKHIIQTQKQIKKGLVASPPLQFQSLYSTSGPPPRPLFIVYHGSDGL